VTKEETVMAEGMTLEEQAEVAREFLQGLLARYGLDAGIETRVVDEETVEIAATGEGLGVLVGPKGTTLSALQDVTRTVVQRQFPGKTDRILVDVAGYRQKRAVALQRFSEQVAAEVVETGAERALEPMSPADRKVVHDSVKEIDGVASRSEGEDPSRYIVIAPAS
jgi:spoIIIJ-associated protein